MHGCESEVRPRAGPRAGRVRDDLCPGECSRVPGVEALEVNACSTDRDNGPIEAAIGIAAALTAGMIMWQGAQLCGRRNGGGKPIQKGRIDE